MRSTLISELFQKLRRAMTLTNPDSSKQKEISSQSIIASLDKRTYFRTALKVNKETTRRADVNSNIAKLHMVLRNLAIEENAKRREFNKSKYYQNILYDD